MKKIRQTLWEKSSFKILVIFFFFLIYAHYPILLKLAHIVCIIVTTDLIENEDNPSTIMGKGSF